MKSEDVTLFFKQGSADKVYTARLIEDGDGWIVNFAYGRRGKPLKAGTKTPSPVPYEKAKAIYDKLVNGKMSKGYTPEEGGVAYSATPTNEEVTGMLPMLLNPIAEEDFDRMFEDWSFVVYQIKYDGENRMVAVEDDGTVIAANRRGLRVGLPETIETALQRLSERLRAGLEICTEDMGDHLVIFDVLRVGESDVRDQGFAVRGAQIGYLKGEVERLGREVSEFLRFAMPEHVMNRTALDQWIHLARGENEEGVVFKDPDAPHTVGRPNSGGPALKYKFVESCTCVVLSQNEGKRSVQLGVSEDDGSIRFIGNVTIPANYSIPTAGQYVEIEYLYAYPGEGSLYQPQYKGVRSDKTSADAYSTLKFKEV